MVSAFSDDLSVCARKRKNSDWDAHLFLRLACRTCSHLAWTGCSMRSNLNLENSINSTSGPSRTQCLVESLRLLGLVRHGRMVQDDAHLTIVAALVSKGVLDRRLLSGGGTGEVVVAHGNGNVTLNFDLVVVVHTIRPALAAIDRKAAVLSVAVLDRLAADKVGHRLLGRWPELVRSSLRRLEEHVVFAVCVKLASCVRCRRDVVAAFQVNLRNAFDRT